MKQITRLLLPAALSLCVAGVASAQATRTWVSGVGDDVNPCSRTAPCKTFAGAISKTASGGEIDALDPAGYGAVTITKAITIDGTGDFASILVSGTNGVVVSAGVSDVVILRRISINGINSGFSGIRFLGGKGLIVEKCLIDRFKGNGTNSHFIDVVTTGANTQLVVRDSAMQEATGTGISIAPGGGNVMAMLDGVRVEHAVDGLNVASATKIMVRNSDFSQNPAGSGLTVGQTSVEADIAATLFSNNAFGIFAGLSGGGPTVRLTNCTITGNTTSGVQINAPATVTGFQTNLVAGNAGNNTISSVASQ